MSVSPQNLPRDVCSVSAFWPTILTVQILDTAGTTEAPAELEAMGGKSGLSVPNWSLASAEGGSD